MSVGPLLLGPFISNPTFSKRKIEKKLDSQHNLKQIINIICYYHFKLVVRNNLELEHKVMFFAVW